VEPDEPRGLLAPLLRLQTFHALRYRQFRLLWCGQVGNGLAQWMDQVARGWLMYELTSSALQLGAVIAIRALPLLFLSPLAGSLADRYSRRTQLVLAQSIDAALYAGTALLIWSGRIEPAHVYALAVGSALVQVFQGPARQVMIAEAVAPRDLTNAIGINSIAWNGSRTIGPAIAGILIATIGTGGCFAVQSLLFALSTIWTLQMRPDQRRGDAGSVKGRPPSLLGSVVEGWRFVARDQTVRTGLIVTALAACFAQSFITLLPVFARDILDVGPTGQGVLLTSMGIGALSSAVLLASLGARLPRGLLMILSAGVYGLVLIGFAASAWLPLSVVFLVAAGAANVFCNALVQTVVQSYSPPELRGRVMGVFQQRELAYTAGAMLVGALATAWGAPPALAFNASICVAGALTILVLVPSVRAIR
jgi:MFS family permease